MRLSPYSFNGTAINDGTVFEAIFPNDGENVWSQTPPDPQVVQRMNTHPKFIGITGQERYLQIEICLLEADPDDRADDRDTLAGIFDLTDWNGDLKYLIAKDSTDSDRQWRVEAVPVGFHWEDPWVTVILAVPDPRWEEAAQQTDSWAITASGQTNDVVVRGNIPTLARFEIMPTGVRGGNSFTYRRFITAKNPQDYALGRQMWNLFNAETGNGLDTATLVTAGKMQADGDDLVINVDGRRVDRYLQDMNTAHTECWIKLHFSPRLYFTLGEAIASTGAVDRITIADTPTARSKMQRMPDDGIVEIDNEKFTYSWKHIGNKYLHLGGVTRAVFGTSMAAHTTTDTVEWIEHAIWMQYGNSDATDPNAEYADHRAPMFLKTSENDRLDYDDFKSSRSLRGNEWRGHKTMIRPVYRRSIGQPASVVTYNAVHSGSGASSMPAWTDPGAYMGGAIMAYQVGLTYLETEGDVWWVFSHPAGIDEVTLSGQKMTTDTDHWPTLELLYSDDGINWNVKATEAVPGSTNTWTNFAINGTPQTLGATYKYIAIHFQGAVAGTSVTGSQRNKAMFEISDVEVSLAGANVPTFLLGSEITTQYEFQSVVITNNTTGEEMYLRDLLVNLNDTVIIDSETRRAFLENDNSKVRQYIDFDTVRSRWMSLNPGTNEFEITDANTGNLTLDIKWRGRNN